MNSVDVLKKMSLSSFSDYNHNFFTAIINWLSEFPNSPINIEIDESDFVNPINIFKLLKLLIDKNDFSIDQDFVDTNFVSIINNEKKLNIEKLFDTSFYDQYKTKILENDDLIIPKKLIMQIECLEKFVGNHFKNFSNNINFHFKSFDFNLNWIKTIIFNNKNELTKLCLLLLKIGTHSSKLSTFGLTSIEFLNDDDKNIINEYLKNTSDKSKKKIDLLSYSSILKESAKQNDINSENQNFFLEKKTKSKTDQSSYVTKSKKFDSINSNSLNFETNSLKSFRNQNLTNSYKDKSSESINISNLSLKDEKENSSFIGYQNYIDSLNWELSIYEELVWNLIKEKNESKKIQ